MTSFLHRIATKVSDFNELGRSAVSVSFSGSVVEFSSDGVALVL